MFITRGQGGVYFEPKNRGLRTAIGARSVRVYPERGAERGGTRLRGGFGMLEGWKRFEALFSILAGSFHCHKIPRSIPWHGV